MSDEAELLGAWRGGVLGVGNILFEPHDGAACLARTAKTRLRAPQTLEIHLATRVASPERLAFTLDDLEHRPADRRESAVDDSDADV